MRDKEHITSPPYNIQQMKIQLYWAIYGHYIANQGDITEQDVRLMLLLERERIHTADFPMMFSNN